MKTDSSGMGWLLKKFCHIADRRAKSPCRKARGDCALSPKTPREPRGPIRLIV
jgi:hypothetical protein